MPRKKKHGGSDEKQEVPLGLMDERECAPKDGLLEDENEVIYLGLHVGALIGWPYNFPPNSI